MPHGELAQQLVLWQVGHGELAVASSAVWASGILQEPAGVMRNTFKTMREACKL